MTRNATTLALFLSLGAAAQTPAADALVAGWYGDLFLEASLDSAGRIRAKARPAFFELPDDKRRAVAGSVIQLVRQAQPADSYYLDVEGGGAGEVYRWDDSQGTVHEVTRWGAGGGKQATESFRLDKARAERPWFLNGGGHVVLGPAPGMSMGFRIGSFLLGGRYDLSVGGGLNASASAVELFSSIMGRRHFVFESAPWISPNVGVQGTFTVNVDTPPRTDASGVIGLGIRPGSANGFFDLVLSVGLSGTIGVVAGYTILL